MPIIQAWDGAEDIKVRCLPDGSLLTAADIEFDVQLDYAGRSDDSPVYLGRAAPGTPTSAPTWTIVKFTWETAPDGSARATRIQARIGAWNDRVGLGW